MKLQKVVGATSEIWQVFIRDSSSTTGAGLTGLVYNSASLTAYYHRDTDTTATAITLVTMTVGTFTSSGFKEIDATNMPGWYQFCPPNAALASGAKSCSFHLKGATNMAPLPIEVQLTAVNPDSATAFMTSVATAVAVTTVNGLANNVITTASINNGAITDAKVADDVKVDVNTIKGQTVTLSGGVTIPAATLASTTNITAGTVTTATNVTTVNGLGAGVITAASIAADAITDAKVASDVTIASVTGAVGSVTGNVGGNVTGSVGSVVGAVGSVTGAVGSVTGNVGGNVVGSVASVTGNVGGNVVGSVASVTAKVTPIDIDGITFANMMKYIGATTQGKCVVTFISGSDYTFDYYDVAGSSIVWTATCTLGGRASITRS